MDKYVYSINGTFMVLQNFYNTEKIQKNNIRKYNRKSKDTSSENIYINSRTINRTIMSKSVYRKNK